MSTELTVSNIVLVAKQHEIEELRHLEARAQLVGDIGALIHCLQNERGASSLFLASAGARFGDTRQALIAASREREGALRTSFDTLLQHSNHGSAKLYSLMAWVLLGLDALPALRAQVDAQQLGPDEAVAAFSRLISGLASLIFEVADTTVNPGISRSLVALFNFVQGKELAGQERAVGAAMFASGQCDAPHQQRILDLIDAQERNFQVFCEFADETSLAPWQEMHVAPYVVILERLRRVLGSAKPGAALDANQSDKWFECCSDRLAAMWSLQCLQVERLQAQCAHLIAEAERELTDSEGLLTQLRNSPPPSAGLGERFFDPNIPIDHALRFTPTEGGAPPVERSIIEVLQAQSERIANMETELDSARRALNERKVIERAKGVLMARFNLTEEAAYKMLQKTSMDQNRRLAEVAEAVLALPAFFTPQPATPRR
ncbi:ANTAR domain-containing protein [Nitrogeniibacter mangrovi]|uniref:ANTAR domain-containing protein n=1 Tax=Nitrogeniibacter mangrovi TaxID=2016596 RepID=A0A6C1B8F6_9RHOO|nr:nitrate regulatory protein [Nitrogeniibacter mangrovi]QID19008.1 ANTAR domain-containing protein [Nitrogeniibacter mangrovi]